jgi:hypothetical protein
MTFIMSEPLASSQTDQIDSVDVIGGEESNIEKVREPFPEKGKCLLPPPHPGMHLTERAGFVAHPRGPPEDCMWVRGGGQLSAAPASLRSSDLAMTGQQDQRRKWLVIQDQAGKLIQYDSLPGTAGPMELTAAHRSGDTLSKQNLLQAKNDALSSALESLDSSASSISNLKLCARPWTTLVGNGLVSELVSSFFANDNCFYLPFIDQECFLHDMQAGDIDNADFCSPLLVNAICALRCVSKTQYTVSLSLI